MKFNQNLFNDIWASILNLGFKVNETDTYEVYTAISKHHVNPDKFMKILIKCGVEYDQLRDWEWTIEELAPHKYHCIGSHPIARRIDIIKENVVV